jgi:hypothetical protein
MQELKAKDIKKQVYIPVVCPYDAVWPYPAAGVAVGCAG